MHHTEMFKDYLENKGLKNRSVSEYLYYLKKFTYDKFNQENVNKFISYKINRNNIGRSFVNNYKKFLMINTVELNISDSEKADISCVELPKLTGKKKQRIIRPLQIDEILLLESNLKEEKYKIQLLLSFFCGLRLGGISRLRVGDFNWKQWLEDKEQMGEARVIEKGDKEGIILVPPKLMQRIQQYILNLGVKDNPYYFLFINFVKETQKTRDLARTWQNKLKQAGIDSGLTKLDNDRKPVKETIVHPHRLRHSLATYLIEERGMDISEVKEILRHSDISSTQIYIHLSKKKLKKKLVDLY